jgi:transcriptional regulatory protein RtcR
MDTVAIGTLGISLDRGDDAERWLSWRPTVSMCRHDDLVINRLELLYEPQYRQLADVVVGDIATVSPETTVRLHPVPFEDPWDFEEVYGVLHTFAREYPFDTDRERYLFHVTTGTHVIQICTFLLTESRHFPGRLLQTSPPGRRHVGKPGRYVIIDLDLSKYDRLAERFASEQREATAFLKAGIETRNAEFNRMIDDVEHVAVHSRSPILLTGPTGAGKSSLARRIFELKSMRHELSGRFVEVNCATLRGDTAMSTLFGHRRGAFTGATHDRPGLLREAHQGILFLDEIAELRLDDQAMLLQAIEQKRFLPVGADKQNSSDFQLICGTNRDLNGAVRAGAFREDLLSRINLWSFRMPGLVDRAEDIAPNLEYELDQIRRATGNAYRFNKEALTQFLNFATSGPAEWLGNFRDLGAAVARMATMAPTGRINRDVVDAEIERLLDSWRGRQQADSEAAEALAEFIPDSALIDEFDRVQLAHVIRVCRNSPSLSAAGRRLFQASRERRTARNDADRLRKYLARFGLEWKHFMAPRS